MKTPSTPLSKYNLCSSATFVVNVNASSRSVQGCTYKFLSCISLTKGDGKESIGPTESFEGQYITYEEDGPTPCAYVAILSKS